MEPLNLFEYEALALGARAVLIGRPLFWGLAVDGARRACSGCCVS